MGNFNSYGLSEEICKSAEMLGYKRPTKVQEMVIPKVLKGIDLIVQSQTGSGKTASFAIPLCDCIEWLENKPQVLVLEPTRELAIQVREDFFQIGRFKRIKALAVYGRDSFEQQRKEMRQKTHVIVGTPGRVLDHLEQGTMSLEQVKYLVIDEADEMFHLGLKEQVESIMEHLPQKKCTLLFSATIGEGVASIAATYMKEPVNVKVEAESLAVDRITQYGYYVENEKKELILKDILMVENPDSCIIFCNTQLEVEKLYTRLKRAGFLCDRIHGGMEQRDRSKVMEHFKRGHFHYLIATDVAARGIDIEDVKLVVNYDLPRERESYVHRIGRTGRVDKSGKAINLIDKGKEDRIKEILTFAGADMEYLECPTKRDADSSKEDFLKKQQTYREEKLGKGAKMDQEIMKIHINAGKKQKFRPADIVGTICGIEDMTAEDIGIIQIKDISTFVEILNHKGSRVLKELQERTIKGRIRNVSERNDVHQERRR